MDVTNNPKKNIYRPRGQKSVIVSFSMSKILAHEMEEFLSKEDIQRSYFIQECIKRGLELHKSHGFVYFIKFGDKTFEGYTLVKIGKTNDPTKRIGELAGGDGTGLPVKLEMLHTIECESAKKVELALHKHFSLKRMPNTEYFKLTDEEIQWILNEDYRNIRGIIHHISY